MYVLLTPLEPSLFRWRGEYSPNFSGPMNRGTSEPLPLISTVAGALYWKAYGVDTSGRDLDAIRDGLGRLWGPLIYVEGRLRSDGKGDRYVLVHRYPGRLAVYRVEGNSIVSVAAGGRAYEITPLSVTKIGVGLDLGSKAAAEHLLYSAQLVDLRNTVMSHFADVRRWGILVRVEKELRNVSGVVPLGADGRLASVSPADDISLPASEGCSTSVLLSPALIPLERRDLALFDDILNVSLDGRPLRELVAGDARVEIIGVGYSTSLNIRRPMYLALMPGSVLKNVKGDSIGYMNEFGWGSLLRFCTP
ncbi:type III-B CRISPR module-associated Cmr3 family protein [Acidilobus sp.]|uniref:type III-B CRISPR module-associated Cmr3 family protein n=1 Tax=Acidilobus sp. TaxID=1872109 RepID=UPI003CFF92F9